MTEVVCFFMCQHLCFCYEGELGNFQLMARSMGLIEKVDQNANLVNELTVMRTQVLFFIVFRFS